MKKYILTLAAIALSFSFANAQNLYIDEVVEVPQGAIGKVAVKYETGGYELKALQLKLDLPAGITVGTNSDDETYEILDAKASKFSVTYANNGWNAFSASTAFSADTEGKGTFMNIFLAADASLGIGTTHEVTVKGPMVSRVVDGASQAYYLDDFTFTVKIVENVTILDENSTEAPQAATGVNVKVMRTIKAGNWGTICLPFAMNEAQVKEAFGDGAELADFTGFTVTERDEDDLIMSISVNFASATSIQANRPYLLKSENEITYEEGFEVKNVDINPGTARVQMDWDDDAEVYQTWFRGTYVPTILSNKNWLFLSGNKFYYAKKDVTKVKGFRGYFKFKNAIDAKYKDISSASVKLFIDNIPTAIESINDEINMEGIYDMSGRKLNEMPKTKGVYIIDGKKVAIK